MLLAQTTSVLRFFVRRNRIAKKSGCVRTEGTGRYRGAVGSSMVLNTTRWNPSLYEFAAGIWRIDALRNGVFELEQAQSGEALDLTGSCSPKECSWELPASAPTGILVCLPYSLRWYPRRGCSVPFPITRCRIVPPTPAVAWRPLRDPRRGRRTPEERRFDDPALAETRGSPDATRSVRVRVHRHLCATASTKAVWR
jgi:hypothetical protein